MTDQTNNRYQLLSKLIQGLLTGELPDDDFDLLSRMLSENPKNLEYYMEYATLWAMLDENSGLENSDDLPEFNMAIMKALAEEERTAEAIVMTEMDKSQELIQKVERKKIEYKLRRGSLFTIAASIAAVLLIVLFIRFAPPAKGVKVAVLSDCMNAIWADVDYKMEKGTPLVTSQDSLSLREGYTELLFDNHTRVIIEGPAEFKILAEDRIGLNYGKVYATVPKEAIGFSVYTQNAKVIDMGTEFGVEAEADGDTQLHVLKGKTMLLAGDKANKSSMEVSRGAAKNVSGDTNAVTDIPCNESSFVRAFNSEKNIIWKSQPFLDMVDIAGMGNGLGTGRGSVIIHPAKGYTKDHEYGFIRPQGFLRIMENPFLDGIFVPNGNSDVVISTRGDIFRQAPPTSGLFSIDLVVNPSENFYKTNLRKGAIEFDGKLYGEDGIPCIAMHANVGLTFDLDAIRNNYHRSIARFTSQIGIADLDEPVLGNADFYVLIDGQIRYSLRQYKQKGVLNDVSVSISESDRFLTLVTTDGGDTDNPQGSFYERANSCDWCVFTEPTLILD